MILECRLRLNIESRRTRLENMQSYVFEKKKMNLLKYHKKSLINYKAAPVPKGTMSIMLNIQSKSTSHTHANRKTTITNKSKFKLKWKTIQWLIDNKKGTPN